MNYSELVSYISDAMHHDGISSRIQTFIMLTEARANRMLRVPDMEQRATATPDDEYIEFPEGFMELRNIKVLDSTPYLLEYITPHAMDQYGVMTGNPRYYTIVGNSFRIAPTAENREVEISYYKQIEGLSESNTTNWLIEQFPDYYTTGCMAEAFDYLFDVENANRKRNDLIVIESMINKRGMMKKVGGGPLVMVSS